MITYLGMRQPVLLVVNAETVEKACKAHWPSWNNMRPDHQRKWRAKMEAALLAATGLTE